MRFETKLPLALGLVAGLTILGAAQAGADVLLSNATTSVVVRGGAANNGLVPYDGYFQYTDTATSEETTWSIDPVLIGPTGAVSVLSNGSAGGFGAPTGVASATSSTTVQGVSVTAVTTLVGRNAKTTFSFSGDLAGFKFLYYAENDLFTAADDKAAFTGTIAGGDLALFQFDGEALGLTVKMTAADLTEATLELFGAGLWTGWGTALEGGDLSVLSTDGSNFETDGDLGLALAFNLSGTTASLVVNYETLADVPPEILPEPGSIATLGLGLMGIAGIRRRLRR